MEIGQLMFAGAGSGFRAAALGALASEGVDVLVVGGGITGAGVARDAAMRGLKVALVEQDDFGSGTSSRSSRLVHGGLRYLEHGELRMVFESSRERRTLLRIAPHLVQPLRFTWPVYRGDRVPRWKIRAGLTLYDALSLFRNVARHRRMSASSVAACEPLLRRDALTGGASYFDARTDDARLTLATILSAQAAGAVVLNHARVTSLSRERNRVTGAIVTDLETGQAASVSTRIVINAAGPWSEQVELLAHEIPRQAMRASKGVHVCIPRARVGNTSALTVTAPQDGRVMFILPAGDFTIIGTTDTFDTVAPEDVHASAADVGYLLDACNHYFPAARLAGADVVSSWAGLRPLAATTTDASSPGGVSREHTIAETMPGLVRVTGGKLTTYRAMAEEIVDLIQARLGGIGVKCTTASTLLDGITADVAPLLSAARSVIGDGAVAERLVHAHGAHWNRVWAMVREDESLGARVEATRPYVLAELRFAIEVELARTFGDLLIRRMPLAFETRDHGREAARTIAPRVARWLGWSPGQTAAQLDAFDAESARMFTVR